MGKKRRWFSAIKRVFTHNSKDKPTNGSKKKGKRISLFKGPSSIEKILGEADRLLIRPTPPSSVGLKSPLRPNTPPASLLVSPKTTLKTASSKFSVVNESGKENDYAPTLEPTLRNHHLSAVKIQAALRGYLARCSFRALRGLVRLQQVVRGPNVKRQMMIAMKQMQLMVRVQTQIQARRIQMSENQSYRNNSTELVNTLSRWTNQLSEAVEDWDDSLLTKEEEDARLQKKVEAVIKRERAMAYAYSHRLWKGNATSDHSPLDIRSNGFPWWWNWLERQLPEVPSTSRTQSATKSITSLTTPPRANSEYNIKSSPRFHNNNNNKHINYTFENRDYPTPRSSSKSTGRSQRLETPTTRTPPPNASSSKNNNKHLKPKSSAFDADSLVSCPPFSIPSYMTPTASAKAKTRANSNPKERFPRTPGSDSNSTNTRFSFPLTPSVDSQIGFEKNESSRSITGFSMDSAVSMPAIMGRKPFNRFV